MSNAIHILKEAVWFRRGMAILFHLTGIVLSFWLAIQLRFDFSVPPGSAGTFSQFAFRVSAAFFAVILAFGLYRGLWRFFTLRDCFITAAAVGAGAILAGLTVFVTNGMSYQDFPRSTLIISFMLLLAWEIGWRGILRLIREHRHDHITGEATLDRVLLMGNPDEADSLLRQLVHYPDRVGRVVGLVSNHSRHRGQQLRGVRIYGLNGDLPDLVRDKKVSKILFLPPLNTPSKIRKVMDSVAESGSKCEYRFIPAIDDIATGRLNVEKLRPVAIEDLLHRPPHDIDMGRIMSAIAGKTVLVTGAGGSIGSEICRQVLALGPACLVLFEASEFALFEIERELRSGIGNEESPSLRLLATTGDIRRADQVQHAIDAAGGIDIIYHAAAYKHVHLMERNPVACFQNNVIGTQTMAIVAEENDVKDFVLVSTDKAVRPTSLMGASKRLAERVLIERPKGPTRFKAVRFGNVLGSSGSVIPIFRKQIEDGGPVTVTSKEVTRFFMTIPEAVELVIAAGAFADDRQICVLEMGEPVRIESLARRMIELSGFAPDVDVPIEFTGLKPGEKEYEELLTDDEGVVRTDHERIWVVEKSQDVDAPPIDMGELLDLIDEGDEGELRAYAHRNIPGSLLFGDEVASPRSATQESRKVGK